MAVTKAKPIGWEEYLALPLTHYEIINGEVYELPTPTFRHQQIVLSLGAQLQAFVRVQRPGYVLPAPYDLVIQRNPLRTRQPDLLFISHERAQSVPNLTEQSRLEIAPELVVEVLSPSESASAWREKLRDYQRMGVQELWVADPEAKEIEVLRLETNGWRSLGVFQGGKAVRSEVLQGLNLTPNQVFEP